MFMKRTDGVRACKTKRKFLDSLEITYVFECLENVRFNRRLHYVCDYKCEKDEKAMFASHASDIYFVGGRQNVWKASYTYLFSCGTLNPF